MKTRTKTCTALVLCFALLMYSFDPPPAKAQVAQGVLIMTCVVIASCIIIKLMRQPPDVRDRVLVLQKSHYDGNWVPVVTNFHAILYASKPVSIFADQLTDEAAVYRVVDITDEYRRQNPLLEDEQEIRVTLWNGESVVCTSNTAIALQP